MNPSSPGDNELPATPPNPAQPGQGNYLGPERGRFTFVASLLLIAIAFCVGLSYVLEKKWLNEREALANVAAPEGAGLQANGATMLQPNGAAARVAIINGKRVAEGDSVEVKTSTGVATLRVTKIENGMIQLSDGGQAAEAKGTPHIAQKNSP